MICFHAVMIIHLMISRSLCMLYFYISLVLIVGNCNMVDLLFLNIFFSVDGFEQEIQCYVCKNFGHLCCSEYADSFSREVSCYKCGQLGHTGLVSIVHFFSLLEENHFGMVT